MRILFLCHRFPFPPDGGGKIRALEMARQLAARHEVSMVSMVRTDAEAAGLDAVRAWCVDVDAPRVSPVVQSARMAAGMLAGRPLSFSHFQSGAVQAAVARQLQRRDFDRIVVHCSAMGPYVEDVPIPKIIDFCDVDSEKWRLFADRSRLPMRALYRFEQHAVRREEARLAARFDVVTVATRQELAALESLGTARQADWFPNGVDTGHFSPLEIPYEPDTLAFVGRMDYLPNEECMVEFCATVWPLVRKARPRARMLIVGAEPSRRVRELANVDGVTVTGTVPDVRPWLARAAAMVAPLRTARGVQNKVLESMAMGVPVVTTSLVARGVDGRDGVELSCADDASSIAAAAVRCMTSAAERARLSAAARRFVVERYSWEGAIGRLEGMLDRIGERPPVGTTSAMRDTARSL